MRLPARRLVDAVLVDAAVDPAAARRRAVVLQLRVARRASSPVATSQPLISASTASALGSCDLRRASDSPSAATARARRAVASSSASFCLDAAAEVEVEPELGAAVLLRLDRLPVPLQQALRVRERAVLLGVRRGGQEEDLGRDLLASRARPSRSPGCRTRTTPTRSRRGRARRASRASRAPSRFALPFALPTAGFSPAMM